MSEYQRYEFMTSDRPLTREELEAVSELSSHIDVSSTHAVVEYHWGDFKHDPIRVLHEFFDGFLYWANWGAPQLALRFPHGVLPADLLADYDCDEFVTFTRHRQYDLLDICFGEMEAPDEWVDYELGSLLPIRSELMEGDLRALYIVWLASQGMIMGTDEVEEDEEDEEVHAPPVPPRLGTLTAAQQALAELLQVPDELIAAAAHHSKEASPLPENRFAAWIELLPAARQRDYLLRLARNEPGLSHMLVRELHELGQDSQAVKRQEGEHVSYATLLVESKAVKRQMEREQREREQQARQRRLQELRDHAQMYWQQAEQAALRGSGSGYAEATGLLVELRDAARYFHETDKFQEDFQAWVQSHLRRPALLRRLQEEGFPLPL